MSNGKTASRVDSAGQVGKQTEQAPDTLSALVERSPYKTVDAKLDFNQNPTRLQIENQSFSMGVCTSDNRLARGLHEYQFRTGPYQIRVKRDDQSEHGTSWRIEATTGGSDSDE